MSSFRALGGAEQLTIAMVAPGISEALIATAIGLFAAIPAVIAYNRLADQVTQVQQDMEIFQEELIGIFQQYATKPPVREETVCRVD
jgi:biopolymer transport protein TolQ